MESEIIKLKKFRSFLVFTNHSLVVKASWFDRYYYDPLNKKIINKDKVILN